jgi:drug/metabolite transporter (DMT)-like permease
MSPQSATPAAPHTEHGAADASSRRLTVLVLAVCTVLLLAAGWIGSGVLVARTPPLAVATGRTAGSFAILSVIAAMSEHGRADVRIVSRRPWVVTRLAFIGYFVYFGGTMLGVEFIGASRAGLIVALMPCAAFAAGAVAYGEQVTLRKMAGTVAAVAAAIGYSLATHSGSASNTGLGNVVTGVTVTLVATVCFAVYGYAYKRNMEDVAPESALPVLFGAATLMFIPAAIATLGNVSAWQWLGSFALGAVFTAPVYVTGHKLFLLRGPLFVATIALAVPFLVRLGDWGLGNASAPNLPSMAFMALCLAGITLVVR